MLDAIKSLFALISLIIKSVHNVMAGAEVMSREVKLSAKSLANDQSIAREITALKAKAKLTKQLQSMGITEDQLRKSAKERADRDMLDSDDAGSLQV